MPEGIASRKFVLDLPDWPFKNPAIDIEVTFRSIAMTRNKFGLLAVLFCILFAAAPLFAHYSFAAQYDRNKPIKFTGVVTKVEWANPHIYYYVDVKDQAGKVTNYAVEGGTPNSLYRQGWRKDSLKVGDEVTVEGFMA